MRKLLIKALLASAIFGLGATQGNAGSYGYGGGQAQLAQYGGGYGGGGYSGGGYGGGYQAQCYWERKHVRIWDGTYNRWTWVWQRVRTCH